jgi:Tfp pilus assembly protein PilX
MLSPRWMRARRLAAAEDGVVLFTSFLILIVITIVAFTLLYYVQQNEHSAAHSRAAQQSQALAEAGMNNALSVLYSAPDPLDPSIVPSMSETLSAGTATWWGSLSGTIWKLTGTGTVQNAGGLPVARSVSSRVQVVYQGDARVWGYLYSDATTGCMTIKNNAVITSSLYVRGNLCIAENAHITGSPLQVEGTLDIGNNGSVGFAASPIAVAKLRGGCVGKHGGIGACRRADGVYANTLTDVTDDLRKPPIDLLGWYQISMPGPANPCTAGSVPGGFDNDSVMNRSRDVFNLTPPAPYDCRVTDADGYENGRISWTPGVDGAPGTLVVHGTVFFDGDVVMNNGATAVYQARGTIYASGAITLSDNATLCAVAACDGTWDSSRNVLMLVAGASLPGFGFTLANNSVYQGGAYVVADYSLENNAVNWGPVIANQIDIKNNGGQTIPLESVPPGTPAGYENPLLQVVSGSFRG